MNDETVSHMTKLAAPFGQEIELLDVAMENDVRLLRIRIREGHRFTVFDIDPHTAREWARNMEDWAADTGLMADQ